ncbi:GNAT family N-acetyltransferase [Derxia gummosa]|uniref:GNAT family N-acetyltransferase n=1 Tax=Derxia gummosa DSM 723 TaxID=1121388 RepID=A0A8B6XAD2_9BURK|nr:GNAT family N-acetyltransferase [Derxia gummosa]
MIDRAPYPADFPLVTERLLLAASDPTDAAAHADYHRRNRAHLAATSPLRPDGWTTEQYWRVALARERDELRAGSDIALSMRLRADPDGPIVGMCKFSNLVRGAFQACHLGYSLDHAHTGQGYMTEALDAAIRYAFDTLGLHRVMANHLPENEASARVLARLGFEREGQARAYLKIAGRWRDHVLNAKINPALPD